MLILDDFHYLQSAVCREQVEFLIENLPGAGAPGHRHPRRPGPPAGPAAGLGAARRDPRRAAELHRPRRPQHCSAPSGSSSPRRVAGAAPGPDRGLAGRRLPRRPVPVRPPGRRRARPRLQRHRPLRHQLLLRGGAQPGLGAGPGLHHHHVDPRPLLRAAVRRGRRHDRARPRSSTTSSARTCSWSRSTRRAAGSGSTTCSPRWPGASSRPGTPTGCPELHQRAAAAGTRRTATSTRRITHLRAAGLRAEAAELVQANWLTFVDAGRAPTVLAWLQSLGQEPRRLRPGRGGDGGLDGRASSATRPGWPGTCSRSRGTPTTGRCPTGRARSSRPWRSSGGCSATADLSRCGGRSQRAVELETDGLSPFYSIAHLGAGSRRVRRRRAQPGDGPAGQGDLCEAAPAIVQVLGLAVQSLAEGELGRLERSRELAERAMEIVDAAACT